jgi:hypothetical protein
MKSELNDVRILPRGMSEKAQCQKHVFHARLFKPQTRQRNYTILSTRFICCAENSATSTVGVKCRVAARKKLPRTSFSVVIFNGPSGSLIAGH